MVKKCFKCNETKKLSEYYKHAQMKDGYLNKCKECSRKDTRDNLKKNPEYYREYDKLRANLPHRVQARKEYLRTPNGKEAKQRASKKYRKNNPEKYAAHIILNNRVRNGLVKKEPCVYCGEINSHGHHADYARPLEVIWVCSSCHSFKHKVEKLKEKDFSTTRG